MNFQARRAEANGIMAQGNAPTITEAVTQLMAAAIERFPKSNFTSHTERAN